MLPGFQPDVSINRVIRVIRVMTVIRLIVELVICKCAA